MGTGSRERFLTLTLIALAMLLARPALADDVEPLSFTHDVRPILMDSCFACHGPDAASREADLRLDERFAALETGAIVPDHPDQSEVIARIFAEDDRDVMPPPNHPHSLTADQKNLIKRWIEEGAEYEPHWSFQPIQRPDVPDVHDPDWVTNPIDHFILQRLEQEGLSPAPEADRRTLARRVSLDLTGLPPTPAQVEAFLHDESPDAYERFVDQLLASVHWGEHRGRHWLDYARYADTHGLHFDNFREVWAYRDWVINAFNDNQPFDQFTREQIAGDLLDEPSLDQLIATGFNRNNITTNEGGTIEDEVRVQYMWDRTDTTATVFLGLTANCAACHDHKYDPFSQEEYYQLAAYFNNTTQPVMDGNVHDTPPIVFVPMREDRDRWDALPDEIASAEAAIEAHQPVARAKFDDWLADREPIDPQDAHELVSSDALHLHAALTRGDDDALAAVLDGEPRDWQVSAEPEYVDGPLGAPVYSSAGGSVAELADAGDFERDQAFSFGAWVRFDGGQGGSVFARMDEGDGHRGWDLWGENGRIGMHLIHTWPEDALKVVATQQVEPNQWKHVFVTYDGSSDAGGVRIYIDGERQDVNIANDQLRSTTRTGVPLKLAQRHNSARIDQLGIYDVRLYERRLNADEVERLSSEDQVQTLLAAATEDLTNSERESLFAWWQAEHDEQSRELRTALDQLRDERETIRSRGTIAHVMQERDEPARAPLLARGHYDDVIREVGPAVLDVLPDMPEHAPNNRLGLAEWFLMDEQPLTARVTVNRFWQEVFGRGIVGTPHDFGMAGEFPTHPELLDWLAAEFRDGWDVKDFFRTLVTSSAYRQAAVVTDDKLEKDPDNRLLSRGPRFRMDGEMVRDYALAASDLLVREVGGASVRPYQPEGVWEAVAMPGSNTRFYEQDGGDSLYRRSLYTFWKRAAPPAFFEIFDAPTRETCTVDRTRTNTPLQALATLNDIQLIEAARHVAERALLTTGGETNPALDHMAEHVMLRPLRSDEQSVLRDSLESLLAYYREHPDDAHQLVDYGESAWNDELDAPDLAAWTMLANQLLNLDEVLTK